jgi:hypothetical protein
MQTSDIINVIKKFPIISERFLGCFPLDKLPRKMNEQTCLIFNRDKSDSSGSHWICIIHRFNNDFEIFDSLGCNFPAIQPFLHFKKKDSKNPVYFFNSYSFQDTSSSACGLFALYFLIHRMMNLDMTYNELLSEVFVENKIENEQAVIDFFLYFAP